MASRAGSPSSVNPFCPVPATVCRVHSEKQAVPHEIQQTKPRKARASWFSEKPIPERMRNGHFCGSPRMAPPRTSGSRLIARFLLRRRWLPASLRPCNPPHETGPFLAPVVPDRPHRPALYGRSLDALSERRLLRGEPAGGPCFHREFRRRKTRGDCRERHADVEKVGRRRRFHLGGANHFSAQNPALPHVDVHGAFTGQTPRFMELLRSGARNHPSPHGVHPRAQVRPPHFDRPFRRQNQVPSPLPGELPGCLRFQRSTLQRTRGRKRGDRERHEPREKSRSRRGRLHCRKETPALRDPFSGPGHRGPQIRLGIRRAESGLRILG